MLPRDRRGASGGRERLSPECDIVRGPILLFARFTRESAERRVTLDRAKAGVARMKQIFKDQARQEEFERQGFTVVRLLSRDAAAAMLRQIDEVRSTMDAGRSCSAELEQSFCTPNADYRQTINALVSEALREPLLELLIDYRMYFSGVMIKRPGGRALNIHRDRTVLDDPDAVGIDAWCPLVDVDDAHGNLVMLPGSHKLPNIETSGVTPFYTAYGERLKKLCVSKPLAAGEAVLFDHRLLHWSFPNQFDEPRPVLRAAAIPADSRIVFYKLDEASGGKRFEILDVEGAGPGAHSPEDVALGTVDLRTLGFIDNDNRPVSFDECRRIAAEAIGEAPPSFLNQPLTSMVRGFRNLVGA